MRILGPADYQVQPWRNGMGATTELASAPRPGGAPGFLWRLSIADVATDGAFSIFPDIDRVITVIEGAGMTLDAGTNGRHVLEPFKPFAFPGEWPIDGFLKAGPVRDFNLMVDRHQGCGSVVYHDFADGALTLAESGRVRFLHLLIGEARGPDLKMTAQQTLLLDAEDASISLRGEGKALYGDIILGP